MIVDTRPMTLGEQERLVKLMQECAEVILAASKAWMYGWAPAHAGVQYDNRADVMKELGDVHNVELLMQIKGDIDPLEVAASADSKWHRMLDHMRHQQHPPRPAYNEEDDRVVVHIHDD